MSAIEDLAEELREARKPPTGWAKARKVLKQITASVSFLAGAVGAIAGFVEYRRNHEKERHEAASRAYAEVDDKYVDFLKLCLERPELDCYSTPSTSTVALTPADEQAQRLMDTILVDVFEFAHIRYHDEFWKDALQRSVDDEWDGWVAYTKKFMSRPHFVQVWCTVRDEYSKAFMSYMDSLNTIGCQLPAKVPGLQPAALRQEATELAKAGKWAKSGK